MIKVTEVQWAVLETMRGTDPIYQPRSSLERLEKKGLVSGNRKAGWTLTDKGKLLTRTAVSSLSIHSIE